MAKYKMNRKTVRTRGRKSTKMGAGELQDMIKAAVKEAIDEQKAEEEEDEPEGGSTDLADILDAAVEAVNEKRKSAKADELNPDDVDELLEAVLEQAGAEGEGKSEEEETDLEEVIKAAVECVNEKRKSAKSDEIGQDVVEEILDAVAEVMSDSSADEEGKGAKDVSPKYEKKSVPANTGRQKSVQRKYSSIYMPRGGERVGGVKKKEVPAHIRLARLIKCGDVWGKHDPEKAAYYAKKNYGDDEMAREFKAMSVTSQADGGFLIPETYADQIIEMLYPKTVIVELGAQQVPLENGNLNIPKMTAGSRATWGGEARKISATSPKYGNIRLSAKRLSAIVPQSRELLMSSSYSSDAMFANDLTRRMQLGLDYGGLYGSGTEFQPMGIAKNKEVENINAKAMNNTDLADASGKITADFPVYISSLAFSKNIDDVRAGWAMNSLLEGHFKNMKTSTGVYIYRDEMREGKLCGMPYRVSNQIPTASDGTTDLFFGNWADLLIGDQLGLETYTTLDGTWTDDMGIQHNAFEENLAATRALMYDDIGVRHPESFMYCKNIKVK